MTIPYPLRFVPDVHRTLWGSETWEVSAHPSSPSVIENGALAGRSLAKVAPGFPLLVKTIDAHRRLSVQVHPNERTAPLTGGEPKTEMWCILGTDGPNRAIYAGFRAGTTARDVDEAIVDGRFEELLVRHAVKPGEVYFIPGGLVHAIGEGVKLHEVQQSSNTTYRLYDWGRLDAAGRPRQLHVAESLRSIDFSLPPPVAAEGVECPFFAFRKTARPEVADRPAVVTERGRTMLVPAGYAVGAGAFVATWTGKDGER